VSRSGGRTGYWPSYASSAGEFEAGRSIFNDAPSAWHRSRAAIMKAAAGAGIFDAVFVGDSWPTGFANGVFASATSYPFAFRNRLASQLATNALTGIIPFAGTEDLSVLTGGFGRPAFAPMVCGGVGAGTITTVVKACSGVGVMYLNNNTGTESWTVDAVGQANMVPTGANSLNVKGTGALAQGDHTVVITNAAGQAYNVGCWPSSNALTAGIRVHNLAINGSTAGPGGGASIYDSWSESSIFYSLRTARLAMLAQMGVTPQLLVISLGGNDAFYNNGPTAFLAGIQSLIAAFTAQYPAGFDIAFVTFWQVNPDVAAEIESYWRVLYPYALSINARVFDFYNRVGGLATAVADGIVSPDGVHPIPAAGVGFGNALADAHLR
jgi:hypothetical protein